MNKFNRLLARYLPRFAADCFQSPTIFTPNSITATSGTLDMAAVTSQFSKTFRFSSLTHGVLLIDGKVQIAITNDTGGTATVLKAVLLTITANSTSTTFRATINTGAIAAGATAYHTIPVQFVLPAAASNYDVDLTVDFSDIGPAVQPAMDCITTINLRYVTTEASVVAL